MNSPNSTKQANKKPVYGWVVAGLGALGNALQGGLVFWSMGIYISSFEDYFGASRAKVTLIETMISVGVNTMSPFVGAFVDKYSARHLVALGCFSMGVGFILISFAGTLLHIWLVFLLLIPFGILALGVVPSATLISRWFRRRRGLALGISVAGSSIGGFIAPLVIGWLFLNYGWRTSFQILGIFAIAVSPFFLLFLANHPRDKQQEPEPETKNQSNDAVEARWTVSEILRTKAMWLQTLVSGGLLFITLSLLANLGLHSKDLGLTGTQTATLYSTIAICSLFGKLAFGALIDRFGTKRSGALTIALMIAAMTLFLSTKDFDGLLIAAFTVGWAIGGVTPLWTSLVAEGFGASAVGRTLGLQNPLHLPLTAPSAPIAGYISDTTGSYDLVFVIYTGMAIVAGIALYFLKPPVRPTRPAPKLVAKIFGRHNETS
ncbi:MAG: MFS transporter [Pseudomonadota bacterium]